MIDLTITDGLAEITLNAPKKLNSLDADDLDQLGAAYLEAADADVRALVLRGEGRAFCAGRDISQVDAANDDGTAFLRDIVTPVLRTIAAFPAPTFAAVQGGCLGVGLGLAIATDVVYVGEKSMFGSPFASLGAALDSGGHALFFERLGAHRALDLIYTGEMMSGADAVDAGLFSRAVPDDELLEFTRGKARAAASGATQAFLASKRMIAQLRDERVGLWASVEAENAAQGDLGRTSDYAEGFRSFQEKRKPTFIGR
ncbi:enoyl-CoA hydratase/isomerase family protein [Homoserinimonas sp. A447]